MLEFQFVLSSKNILKSIKMVCVRISRLQQQSVVTASPFYTYEHGITFEEWNDSMEKRNAGVSHNEKINEMIGSSV